MGHLPSRSVWLLCAALSGVVGCHSPADSPDAGGGVGGNGDGAATTDGAAVGSTDLGAVGAPDLSPPPPTTPQKESLVWVWQDYANTLATVASHASSFTQVSPALYQVNYAYASGAAMFNGGGADGDQFDGLTASEVSQKIHAAGLKCIPLVYGGAGNSGTDQGIQNILNDAPSGAKQSFITSMVAAAVSNGYDGFNLDWEVGNTGHDYSDKLVAFLTAFRDALHAKGMTLSLDLGGWYVQQCTDSGGNGFVDLTTLGASVDWAIIEDYSGALGDVSSGGCPSGVQSAIQCANDFVSELDVMCDLPPANVSIGLISPEGGNGGTNVFAGDALQAVTTYGFRAVAIWPDDSVFLNADHISPAGATWYSLLEGFLAQ